MKKIIFPLILFLGLFGFTKVSLAADVEANSCSRADVLAAYNLANDGDTIKVPAGTCDWTGGTLTAINVTKSNISFIGAGIDQTIIKAYSISTSPTKFFVYHEASGSSTFWRISGFTFVSNDDCSGDNCAGGRAVAFIYRTANFRFDHNKIDGYFGGPAVQFKSINKGLFDHNTFINRKVVASGSYYGLSGGQPYDGNPNPISHDPNNPSALPRCNVTTSPDLQCNCQAGLPADDRNSSVASGKTAIAGGTNTIGGTFPATADIKYNGIADTGTVRRIYIYIESVGANPTVTIASFSGSGNVFTARARSTPLSVKVGSNIFTVDDGDFTPFAIHDGDYIGVYLNNAVLSASTGNTSWSIDGDKTNQSSVNFGSLNVGGISLWAELFDDSGRYAACEAKWDTWYTDEATRNFGFRAHSNNWAYDENAIYFEDNYFSWPKSGNNLNWGASSRMVTRYNTFDSSVGSISWCKPGNTDCIWHNNIFNKTGSTGGYVHFLDTSSLVYNNTYNNYAKIGGNGMYRNFSDYYIPYSIRPKESFSWSNTCNGCSSCVTGGNEANCWWPLSTGYEGIYWVHQEGENGAFVGRAPQSGDRVYNNSNCAASRSTSNTYGVSTPTAGCYVSEYPYPHPLTLGASGDTTAPSAPTGLTVE